MERGVASRGGVSQPLAVGARHPPSGHYTTGVRGERLPIDAGASHAPWARREARSAGAAAPARYLGAPPPLISGARSQNQNPGAKRAAGTKKHALFDK